MCLLGISVSVQHSVRRSTLEGGGSFRQLSTKPFSVARVLYWFILCENNMNSPVDQPGSFLLTDGLSGYEQERPCEEVFFNSGGINHNKISILLSGFFSCQISVVINNHYDRNSKKPTFHLVINVPIWSFGPLYLSSPQGWRFSPFFTHICRTTANCAPMSSPRLCVSSRAKFDSLMVFLLRATGERKGSAPDLGDC